MRRFLTLALVLGFALPLGLVGCGKKGALQPPPAAPAATPAPAEEQPRQVY